ncbi:MAG: cytochrome c oxidase assembly protein [Candidatus Korobacteraceae bacterium]|jgi:cytochrome c oxidase assembly factor CtaG
MPPVSQAVLLSWSVPPAATLALVLTALVYLRGWVLMRHAGVPFVPLWRAVSFLLGLLSLWIALASPLDTFSGFVLTAHMLQHMMLMMLAPPLLLLGAPVVPLVRGLPVFAAREFAGPFLNWRVAKRVGSALTHPIVALLLMGGAMFAWHTPRLYELALASSSWHQFEHACFFLASLVFWWPVIQPWPSRTRWPRWAVVPYLLVADLENTALAAILVFSDRLLYPSYDAVPRLFGFSALHDQAAAGAIMWVMGSLAFVVPAIGIAIQCLQSNRGHAEIVADRRQGPSLDGLLALSQRLAFPARFLRDRLGGRRIEAISFLLLFAVTGLYLAHLASSSSDDDNQVLRLSQQSGPFAVSVFAPAGELEAGSSDFSVLIQNRNSQDVLQDATVALRAEQAGNSRRTQWVRTRTEDSENKLLQSASLDLPHNGDWLLDIAVARGGEQADFSLPLHVVKPATGMSFPWSYGVLLAFSAILLFAYLRRHLSGTLPVPHPAAKTAPQGGTANLL